MTQDIYIILKKLSIKYERIDHPPVYTSEQARRLVPHRPAVAAKNLFLRDKKGQRHFLLVMNDQKSARFKEIEKQVGISHLSMASPKRLEKYLGVKPGAVSMLALINDMDGNVQLLIDRSLWEEKQIQAHPLVNTSTLIIPIGEMKRFLDYTGHTVNLVDVA